MRQKQIKIIETINAQSTKKTNKQVLRCEKVKD